MFERASRTAVMHIAAQRFEVQATVLARRYMRQVKEDMSWGKTTADLKQRVRL